MPDVSFIAMTRSGS